VVSAAVPFNKENIPSQKITNKLNRRLPVVKSCQIKMSLSNPTVVLETKLLLLLEQQQI